MSYQPFLIANYATGLDKELQPWLLPKDALTELVDGFVYRGVLQKRDGYSGYATGENSTYTESRMVHQIANVAPETGVIDGDNDAFGWTLTTPVARGRVVITGNNPAQVMTDDGLGAFTGDGTGTIDYSTGVVSIIFTTPPAVASTVLLTYSYHQGLPVMGIMSFYPSSNIREMIVADTRYVNKYNPTTDRLDDIAAGTYTGGNSDFWSWVNYEDSSNPALYVPRLLFSNGVVGNVIQVYNGTTIANYAPTFGGLSLNARQMFEYKDRLILFQTIENNIKFPKRIRISGTGSNCDVFDNTATGAGFIDIPDNTQFFGAAFNRDDLMFFTEGSTWVLKYTGNDVTPFVLQKIDNSRGSAAAFSVISYLNSTMAASRRGLIITDGYQVERMDNNIPDFTFDDVNGEFFDRCFSSFVDEDRDVYMTYPSLNEERPALVPTNASDEILVTNFEEDNFSIYKIPLSCMGNYEETIVKQWQDLTALNGFPSWNALATQYNNWNAFPFSIKAPISIGGGHKGEIWVMNATQGQDNPQMIRDIAVVATNRITVTTDWNNYNLGDYIYFSDVEGMTNINDKQGEIVDISVDYTTFDVVFGEEVGPLDPYTSGGWASKSFEFSASSTKLNPWVNMDKKIRCGWMYFYVNETSTYLTTYNVDEDGNETHEDVPATLTVEVITSNNDYPNASTPQFKYEVDCTNINREKGSKKWVKIWINQVGQFLQFRITNRQAGADIQVHAMMCGFQPVGRLI